MNDFLEMWVVYDHPSDAPDEYVARLWLVVGGQQRFSGHTMASSDLDFLRRMLQRRGLVKIDRMPEDDPVIMETWL